MPKKTCKDANKIKNPRTNYCVKKDGAIGRRVQGKARKYMDTPALRAAIAKEKAKGKTAFTTKKKKKKSSRMELGVWYDLRKDGMLLRFVEYEEDSSAGGIKAELFKGGKIIKGKMDGFIFKKNGGGSIDLNGIRPKKSKVQPKAKAAKKAKGNEMLGGVGLEKDDKRDSVMKVGNSYEYKSGDGRHTYTFKKGKTFKGARQRWSENTFWRAKVLEILPNFKMKVLIGGFQTPANTRETTKYKRDFFRKEIIASFKRGTNKDSGNMGDGIYNPNEIYLDLDGIRESIGEVFLKKGTLNKNFGIDKRSQEDKKKFGSWG